MRKVGHRRGSAVALVAACILVLQSFLGGWAGGAFAATPMLDAFGNPPCTAGSHHDGSAPAHDHSKLPDCCTFGCSMVSPLLAAAPGDETGLLRPRLSNDVRFDRFEAFHIQSPDHHPGSPRAPPLMT